LQISNFLLKPENFKPWIVFLKQLLDMKVPDSLENKINSSEDFDERNNDMYWKIKEITTKIAYRLLLKKGKPGTYTRENK
jgi:hypothetical protein